MRFIAFMSAFVVVVLLSVSSGDGGARAATGTPPGPPSNPTPGDGASQVGANPLLCVDVLDAEADALDVQFLGRELTGQPAEDFTLIALPDSQFYSQSYPQIWEAQIDWILDNMATRNIRFVSQLGDFVHNGHILFEWQVGEAAMARLEDPVTTMLPEGLPYGVVIGNHDNNGAVGTFENQNSTLLYNQTFGVSRFDGRSYYGGHFGTNNDNHYELFSASGMDFIIFHLEYDQSGGALQAAVLDWVDDLLKIHSDRRAILSGHYLINIDGSFGDGQVNEGNQGQAAYDALRDNPNLFLMLCAHLWANPRRSDTFDGNTIHTLMSNYHDVGDPNGGNGWMRIMTFSPAQDEIRVETYSPFVDEYRTDAVEQFTLPYDMAGGLPFQEIGSVSSVPSGSSACRSWPGRQDGAQYEWIVKVSDGTSTTTGPPWTFGSTGSCNLPEDCDDGEPCTSDACSSTVCDIGATPNCCVIDDDCDDGNPCTDDACQAGSCQFTNNTGACTDGNACTANDTCSGGTCSGTLLDCDDANDCTSDSCDDGACRSLYAPGAGCCSAGSDCDDANPCTTDTCGPTGDCSNDLEPGCCVDAIECQDGLACTADICTTNRAAIYLDGSGAHVSMGQHPASETGFSSSPDELNTAEFTIECWFKWDGGGQVTATSNIYNDSGGIEAYALISKGRDQQDTRPAEDINYFLGILEPGHVLAADFEEHATGSSPGLNHPTLGTTPVSVGVWHHAAATYDGCCWQLYLDGQPETNGAHCPGVPPNFDALGHFALGTGQRSEGETEGGFSGWLDEARVWNRALSPAEILTNMNEQIEFHPDLLGRWGLDEAVGFVAEDSAGNDLSGKLMLAEWETSDLPPFATGSCAFPTIPGCCEVTADCDDANACTADACVDSRCENPYEPVAGCCTNDAQCDDGDPCTDAACDGTGSCINAALDTDGDLQLDCVDGDDDDDRTTDGCDNCVVHYNPAQGDFDGDLEGDVCDLDDGVIQLSFAAKDTVSWQEETGFELWNVYMGDLDVLVSSGIYTQRPGSNPSAAQECGRVDPFWAGVGPPVPGTVAYFLTTGVSGGIESDLGSDSSGAERPNDHPCP